MISVLCVSRDEPQRILAREALEREGDIRAGTATSGREALSSLASFPYDAMVADMSLQDMDGIALLRAVREKGRIPFILITDPGMEGREDEAIVAGADFCVTRIPDTSRQYTHVARWIRLAVGRSRKEAALVDSEVQYRELIENASLIIVRLDKDSKITFINEYGRHYFGLDKDELLKRPLSEILLFAGGADPVRDMGNFVRDVGAHPDRYAIRETEYVKKNGERVWISWRNKPILDRDNTVIGVTCFGTDITESRKAEQALFKANQKIKLLNSITRHDILNQLTILGGYIELSRESAKDKEMLAFIERERTAAKAIRTMINFTKDYQDIGLYRPQWQYLKNIVSLLANALDFGDVVLKNELGRLRIYADPMFEKVVYTLLENAIRHGCSLTFIRFSYQVTRDGCLVICEDDGVGVPGGEKEKIFQREFGKHTGFGLFLAREILGITGIVIRETGIPAKGARFEILIPEGAFEENTKDRPG
jgi:PAS domain S-box-containing protein